MKKTWRRFLAWVRGDDLLGGSPASKNALFVERYGSSRRAMQPGDTADMINTTLVSMSAEETANWLRDPAGTSWLDHTVNPTLAARVTHMNARVRMALFKSADLFAEALDGNSEHTAARLRELKHDAEQGDQQSMFLMVTLIGQLINTAFSGGGQQ